MSSDDRPSMKKPRWRLLLIAEIVVIVAWVVLKLSPHFAEQGWSGALDLLFVVAVFGVALIWLIFFSRLTWRNRLIGIGLMMLPAALLKIDGHTGSFFPQLSWRWSKTSATEMPELTGEMAKEGEAIETAGPAYFPRLLGENMNNRVTGELLPDGWAGKEPKELWRIEMGEGWSGFAVAGRFAYTMDQRGSAETTTCYELETGNAVWSHAEEVRFEESMGGNGPRSTPTVDGGKVYSFGATGILNCLDARTGDLIWRKNVLRETGQSVPKWAKSCSPLIVDGKVIVTLGSEAKENLAAFTVESGELVWRSGDYPSSYASPVVATLAGNRQIVAVLQKAVAGFEIATGEELWSFPIGNPQSNCASPLIVGNTVITSSGYGYGTHRIEIEKVENGFEAKELWHSLKLKAKFADMIIDDGYLYGLNDGRLTCLDLETGKSTWRGGNYGHGQLLGVGEHMIVQSEQGDVYVIELNPEDEIVVSEFDALDHRTWNHPALAGRILLVRNDREAVAFKY
ncbi:PQQ-binding-like beta-propeller repeat protein [Akkermansiaceae bacterium]|nr:PQQ-binding-like beta-propeller repeat protein [Akkermansiaceae bacterium]MDA9830499.1 PQQ-binding-like beta-propeller repeat protein [Akkermansiaceae bacterium]